MDKKATFIWCMIGVAAIGAMVQPKEHGANAGAVAMANATPKLSHGEIKGRAKKARKEREREVSEHEEAVKLDGFRRQKAIELDLANKEWTSYHCGNGKLRWYYTSGYSIDQLELCEQYGYDMSKERLQLQKHGK